MKPVKETAKETAKGKVKTTFKKVLELLSGLNQIDASRKDRLSLYLGMFREVLKPILETYTKEVGKIDQEHCSVDAEGNFFMDEKGNPLFSKFSKDGMKKRETTLDKLLDKEVEIDTAICSDLSRVKTLHISFITLFNGFVFNLSEKELEELYEVDPKLEAIKN